MGSPIIISDGNISENKNEPDPKPDKEMSPANTREDEPIRGNSEGEASKGNSEGEASNRGFVHCDYWGGAGARRRIF